MQKPSDQQELKAILQGFQQTLQNSNLPWYRVAEVCLPSTPSKISPGDSRTIKVTAPAIQKKLPLPPLTTPPTPSQAPETSARMAPEKKTPSMESKVVIKAGSFTLEPPPMPLTYDLSSAEKWFNSKNMPKISTSIDVSVTSIKKLTKLPPIILITKPASPFHEAMQKLSNALGQHFLPSACFEMTSSLLDQIHDSLSTHRLRLVLIEPDFEPDPSIKKSSLCMILTQAQLQDPSHKLLLWKSLSQHLHMSD